MDKEELIKSLKELQNNGDYEAAHSIADNLLLEFINDKEIEEEYDKIGKWYS